MEAQGHRAQDSGFELCVSDPEVHVMNVSHVSLFFRKCTGENSRTVLATRLQAQFLEAQSRKDPLLTWTNGNIDPGKVTSILVEFFRAAAPVGIGS